jgi:Fe-S cluster biogenesis protein NfuA
MLNGWKECKLSDNMEPLINTDERRFEIMHLRSSAVFLNIRGGCDQEGGQG